MHKGAIFSFGLVLTALAGAFQPATAAPIYEVRTGGTRDCVATGAPGDGTGGPGVSITGSASDPDFHSWFAQANQQSLNARSRAIKSGGSLGLFNCAGSAARMIIDDLVFSSTTGLPTDVTLSLRYQGTLSASAEAFGQALMYNLVTLDGFSDESGNSSGLGLLDQSNDGVFSVSCTELGCSDENADPLTSASSFTRTIDIILTHTWTNVAVNTAVSLELGLEAGVFARKNFGVGGSGTADFRSDGLTFANPGAVFGLDSGVTATSGQLGLLDNSLGGATSGSSSTVALSEPSPAGLLAVMLAALALRRRRCEAV